jgi:phosphoribosylglycinamide formyltransferase-1
MRIGLIVADVRHLKTAQVARGLYEGGKRNIGIYTVPFVHRKPRSPLFEHRPYQFDAPHPREIAVELDGVDYVPLAAMNDLPTEAVDIFLMTGGILIPNSMLETAKVRFLNVHAGLIPEVRGLDAFKWAILEQTQVGITLHEIDARVDMGKIIVRRATPVFESDTLQDFAWRHYLAEVDLLVKSLDFLEKKPRSVDVSAPLRAPRMRMKAEGEARLEAAFIQYKAKFSEM